MKNYLSADLFKKRKFLFAFMVAVFISVGGLIVYSRYTQVLPQSAIYFLNDISMPISGQKVLIFSPHPDDESIGVGGYIYDAVKNGAEVKIILVTDGNKHRLKDKRYAEFRKATGLLGIKESDLVFLNHPDGKLGTENRYKLVDEFKGNIDSFQPDVLIYPSPSDTHPDHAVTGIIVQEIIHDTKYDKASLQYLVHYNNFPQPKKYAPNFPLLPPLSLISFDKEWQRHMLSQETENTKKAAIYTYKSQLKTPFLRSLILSSIRKNELFSRNGGQ